MDKVRFEALERLDLVDADALQDLVYTYVMEAMGGIMGYSVGGALTRITFEDASVHPSYSMTLGPFQFYHVLPSEGDGTVNAGFRGRVVTYRPQDGGQGAVPSFTDARNAANTWFTTNAELLDSVIDGETASGNNIVIPPEAGADYILWARPIEVETDTDARRRWNVDDGKEDPVALKTRKRTRVEFQWKVSQPSSSYPINPDDIPWTGVAKLLWILMSTDDAPGSGNNKAQLIPISVWDSPQEYASTKEDVRVKSDANALDADVPFQTEKLPDTVVGQTWDTMQSYGTHDVAPPNPATQTNDQGGGGATSVSYLMSPGATARADLLKHGHLDYSNENHGNAAFGLIQILHLMRSRIRAHLGNKNGWENENFFWAGAQPWWALPEHGLFGLKALIEGEEYERKKMKATLVDAIESLEFRQFQDDSKIYGHHSETWENGYAQGALQDSWSFGMVPVMAGFGRVYTPSAKVNKYDGMWYGGDDVGDAEYEHLPHYTPGTPDGPSNFSMTNTNRSQAWGVTAGRNMPGDKTDYDWLHNGIEDAHFTADEVGVYYVTALNPMRCHTIDVAQVTLSQTFWPQGQTPSGPFGSSNGDTPTPGQAVCVKVGIISRSKLKHPGGSLYNGDVPVHVFRVQLYAYMEALGGSDTWAGVMRQYEATDWIPEFYITFFGRKFRTQYPSELVSEIFQG